MKIHNLINTEPGYAIISIENMNNFIKLRNSFFKKFKTTKKTQKKHKRCSISNSKNV